MASVKPTYKIKLDDKNFKKLSRELLKAKDMRVRVGVPSADFKGIKKNHEDSKITMVELAFIHEFGSSKRNIPERSFLRLGLDRGREQIIEAQKQSADEWLLGYGKISLKQVMSKIGLEAQNQVRKIFISSNGWPNDPNSAQYKKKLKKGKKGGTPKALIDTGQLMQSITFEVTNE